MSVADKLANDRYGVITTLSGRYSRFVGWMKFILPMLAVALIALVIGWTGLNGEGDGFRFSIADLAPDAEGNLGITQARFASTDRFERPFLVTAEHATQDANGFDVFTLDTLQADISLNSGTWITVTAASGRFERSVGVLELGGPISMFTDIGYEFHAEQAVLDLEQGTVDSHRPVQGHGPLGAIWSKNGVKFSTATGALTFLGGVRVILNPAAAE